MTPPNLSLLLGCIIDNLVSIVSGRMGLVTFVLEFMISNFQILQASVLTVLMNSPRIRTDENDLLTYLSPSICALVFDIEFQIRTAKLTVR